MPQTASAAEAAFASLASLVCFFSPGYGARLLAPLFARPTSWRMLEGSIAFIMFWPAAQLLQG